MNQAEVIERIKANAARAGFSPIEAEGFDAVWHRRKFMPSRFGLVDAVVAVRAVDSVATVVDLGRAGEDAIAVALANKTWLPRGLGSAVEVHPITIAADAAPDAVDFARTQSPNRWGAIIMHALVYGDSATIVMFDGRKVWGAAYVRGLKKQLADLMA